MAKKRSHGRKGSVPSASPRPSSADTISWPRIASVAAAAFFALVLLFGWLQPFPLVVVPLLVGLGVGVSSRDTTESLVASGFAGVVGGAVAGSVYPWGSMLRLLQSMPTWANPDVPGGFYQSFVLPTLQQHAVNASGGAAAAIVLAAVTIGTAFGTSYLLKTAEPSAKLRRALAWALTALVALLFAYTAFNASAQARTVAEQEPVAQGYSYDAFIYLKTYYEMRQGEGFYPAAVDAVVNDKRFAGAEALRDGKLAVFYSTPTYFRQPQLFYLWKYLAPTGGWIVTWSVVVCALSLVGLYWAGERHLGARAVFLPMIVMPVLLTHTAYLNAIFPDWWAALGVLWSSILLMRGHPAGAAAAALLGAMARFVALPMLLALLVAGAVVAFLRRKEPRSWVPLAAAGVALVVFGGVFAVHLQTAKGFLDPEMVASVSTAGLLAEGAGRAIEAKALSATYYLMFPYGFFALPLAVLFLLAPLGFVVGLRRDRLAQLTLAGYVVAWAAFLLTVGASSSYWGQLVTVQLVLGFALLVSSIDGLLRPRAWFGREAEAA